MSVKGRRARQSRHQPADRWHTVDAIVARGATDPAAAHQRFSMEVDDAEDNPSMNLAFWLPAMFALGLVAMGLCYLFMDACEKI